MASWRHPAADPAAGGCFVAADGASGERRAIVHRPLRALSAVTTSGCVFRQGIYNTLLHLGEVVKWNTWMWMNDDFESPDGSDDSCL